MTSDHCQAVRFEKDLVCEAACATTVDGVRLCGSCALEFSKDVRVTLDPDAAQRVRTNQSRSTVARLKRFSHVGCKTPLMELANKVALRHQHHTCYPEAQEQAWHRLEHDFLVEVFGHVEQRILRAEAGKNARARATLKWLGRWMLRINAELTRREWL